MTDPLLFCSRFNVSVMPGVGCLRLWRTLSLVLVLIIVVAIAGPLAVAQQAERSSASKLADPNDLVLPLIQAHAHNDYLHPQPLHDAIRHGFCNVEADIHLIEDQLLIGHDASDLKPGRTLKSLYLKPLRELAKANGGHVYPNGPPFTLLIDLKTDGETTYPVLAQQLAEFEDLISTVDHGKVTLRAVNVVISGNRPIETIRGDEVRHCGIDGRLSDLSSAWPASDLPMISDRWGSHFRWDGEGVIPESEREKLRSIVRQAHEQGRRVRFWATPEKENLWRELMAANVDLINTDELQRLQEFLTENAGN